MRRAASSLVAGLVGTWLPGGWPGGMAQELDRAVARAQDAGRGEAVLFVSPDDNDAHPGTQAEPFATITKARDPLFIDADANDYRYAPGSPAFSLGVPQSDAATASGVGLRPSFPYLHALPARAEAARANPGEP